MNGFNLPRLGTVMQMDPEGQKCADRVGWVPGECASKNLLRISCLVTRARLQPRRKWQRMHGGR